jgi:tetratricopeptide (TPR) repeat protein
MTMKISRTIQAIALCGALLGGAAQAQVGDAQLAQLKTMEQFLTVMQDYYALIERIRTVASDKDTAAIQQLMKIEDIYKKRGDRAQAIVVLRQAMTDAKSSTVRNAAAYMLAEALNDTGQASEAVEVLKQALEANLH